LILLQKKAGVVHAKIADLRFPRDYRTPRRRAAIQGEAEKLPRYLAVVNQVTNRSHDSWLARNKSIWGRLAAILNDQARALHTGGVRSKFTVGEKFEKKTVLEKVAL